MSSAAQAYLEHLSDHDLEVLATARPDLGRAADAAATLRAQPVLVLDLITSPKTAAHVFDPTPEQGPPVSPFLVFAVATERVAVEIAGASYVDEWMGPRRRAPVFDVDPLREFLSVAERRFFLAELLASYTKVSSGSVVVLTRRGLRRQRFSELDPVALAGMLDLVPELERPGVYRRLGDLALFLTGVFPDHTAAHGLSGRDEQRLLRAGQLERRAPAATVPGFGDAGAVNLLEELGRRWYRLAGERAPVATASTRVARELAQSFGVARRILNVITDRYLFPLRSRWFGIAG
jgi:hypothetical protein